MKFDNGRWVEKEAFNFHMAAKEKIREFIFSNESDELDIQPLVDMPFNEKWAICEAGDGGMVKGEDFLNALLSNYYKVYNSYGGTESEMQLAYKMSKYALALFRNDSAYYERIYGIISLICNCYENHIYIDKVKFDEHFNIKNVRFQDNNKELFFKVEVDNTKYHFTIWSYNQPEYISFYHISSVSGVMGLIKKERKLIRNLPVKRSNKFLEHFTGITMESNNVNNIKLIQEWWNIVDKRKRTKLWLNKIFNYIIHKYQTNQFYFLSINMCLMFITSNAEFWKHDETGNPENWFPYKRGKLSNALFGGAF